MKQLNSTFNIQHSTLYDIPCVIFAGGKSRRMGRDKSLLPFGGFQTLTEFQINKFEPYFEKVYVSCKSESKFNFDAEFIEDLKEFDNSAPMIGLISVFEQVDAANIFILSVDTPFFDIEHFKKLYENIDEKSNLIAAKTSQKKHPLCAIYNRKVIPFLKESISQNDYKLHKLFDKILVKFVTYYDEKIFTNLNYPNEYKNALKEN